MREKSLGKLSQQVSSRDLPSHLRLKERISGQDTVDEVNQRDLLAELEDREKTDQLEKSSGQRYRFVPSLEQATQVRLALKYEYDREREAEKNALLDSESTIDPDSQKPVLINARMMAQLDADEDFGSDISESDLDDDDDDEDDPAELMAELNRIKQEKLAEEQQRESELKDKEEQFRRNMAEESSFSIKRRWDDDVPFKNCARDEPDPKRKLYLNDTLRQEFHRKFMDKYIR